MDQGPQGLLMGPKGPIDGVEGCSPPQELEKAREAATFLVSYISLNLVCIDKIWTFIYLNYHWFIDISVQSFYLAHI